MTKLDKKVSSPIKQKFRKNANMSSVIETITHSSDNGNELQYSIMRGKLLRYSQFIPEVSKHINELKCSNPKYLNLINQIIDSVIYEHPQYTVNVDLDQLLSKFNDVSYNNSEVLDFTKEVLIHTDSITTKLFLASITENILVDKSLKNHFLAATPFVKYIVASISSLDEMNKSIAFMNAVKILINHNADYKKIALLPKIKYIIDGISSKNYEIDITKIIYSKISHKTLSERLKNIKKELKSQLQSNIEINLTDYLTTNSL